MEPNGTEPPPTDRPTPATSPPPAPRRLFEVLQRSFPDWARKELEEVKNAPVAASVILLIGLGVGAVVAWTVNDRLYVSQIGSFNATIGNLNATIQSLQASGSLKDDVVRAKEERIDALGAKLEGYREQLKIEPTKNRFETLTHPELKKAALDAASRLRAIQAEYDAATARTEGAWPTSDAERDVLWKEERRREHEARNKLEQDVAALRPELLLIYDELTRRLPSLRLQRDFGRPPMTRDELTFGAGAGGLNQGAEGVETYARALPNA